MGLYDRLLPTLADITPEDPNEKLRKYLLNSAQVSSNMGQDANTAARTLANKILKINTDQEARALLANPDNPLMKANLEGGNLRHDIAVQPRVQNLSDLTLDYNTGATQGKLSNLPLEIAADRSNLSKVPTLNDIQLQGSRIGLNKSLKEESAFTPENVMGLSDADVISQAKIHMPGFTYDQESISDPSFVGDLRKSLLEKSVGQESMIKNARLGASGLGNIKDPALAGYAFVNTPEGPKMVPDRTLPSPNGEGDRENRSDAELLRRARKLKIETTGKDRATLEKEVYEKGGDVEQVDLTPSEKLSQQRFALQSYKDNPTTVMLYGSGQMPGLWQIKSKLDSLLKSTGGDYSKLSPQQKASFVYQFNKLNDPNSAVLTGEYAAVASRLGIGDRAELALQKAISGEPITDDQAKDIYNTINLTYEDALQNHFQDLADREADLKTYGVKDPLMSLGVPKEIRNSFQKFKGGERVTINDTVISPNSPKKEGSLPTYKPEDKVPDTVQYFLGVDGNKYLNENYKGK